MKVKYFFAIEVIVSCRPHLIEKKDIKIKECLNKNNYHNYGNNVIHGNCNEYILHGGYCYQEIVFLIRIIMIIRLKA